MQWSDKVLMLLEQQHFNNISIDIKTFNHG